MLSTKLKEAAGNSADATLYVDDVFSTYLYTGNASTQTITNGIDLAGKGGMVWIKDRSASSDQILSDTARGITYYLSSNNSLDQGNAAGAYVSATSSSGFSIGSAANVNASSDNFASWTFRKAAKFFDVVTYTGDGTSNRAIAHSLGTTVGMVMTKSTSATGGWNTYHRSATGDLVLNTTAAQTGSHAIVVSATDSTFTVTGVANTNGVTYVAYLFAHDTSSTGIIQCGSFDSGAAGAVNLGWEPQYILKKRTDGTDDWQTLDVTRGWSNTGVRNLVANASYAEWSGTAGVTIPTATGFSYSVAGGTYIYLAIRRPNKPPTSGTQVYNAIARTGTSAAATVTGVGFAPDLTSVSTRTPSGGQGFIWQDRLRGATRPIWPSITQAETTYANEVTAINQDGITVGTDTPVNQTGYTYINHFFKRAPGFFDEVCYTGTGANTTQAHNLTVVPELMIVKERSAVNDWWVYVSSVGNTKYSVLNSTAVPVTSSTAWNNTTPTASVFSIGTATNVNASAQTFVAYLFATLAGISKVGSYTGNGTGQVIACGFSAGARFVLIKRTDATGDWYTFDSARGLTVGSSPYLRLNSAAVETTGNNGVYASTGGFTLGATASTTTNINAATYIFLAVA